METLQKHLRQIPMSFGRENGQVDKREILTKYQHLSSEELIKKIAFLFRNMIKYDKTVIINEYPDIVLHYIATKSTEYYGNEECSDSIKSDIIFIISFMWSQTSTPFVNFQSTNLGPYILKILQKLPEEESSERIIRIMELIDKAALNPSSWVKLRTYLVNYGIIETITILLDKWRDDMNVLLALLSTIKFITFRTKYIRIIKQVKLESGKKTNLPEILKHLLLHFEPKMDNIPIIKRALINIGALLFGSNKYHHYFEEPRFINHLFSILSSQLSDDQVRHDILFTIIIKLSCNNPKTMRRLLLPHSTDLQDLAVFHKDSEVSRAAATILKTYMSCEMTRHECMVVRVFSKLTLLMFILMYSVDVVGDLLVAYLTITTDKDINLRMEGYLLVFFSVVPLIHVNFLSYQQFKTNNDHTLYTEQTDQVISIEGHVSNRTTGYLIQWRFDGLKHTLFNILSILQLRPIISAIEIVYHKPQQVSSILSKMLNFTRLNLQEKILENVPSISLKLLILYRSSRSTLLKSGRSWIKDMDMDDYLTLSTTLFSAVSLILSIIKFEKLCRKSTISSCSVLSKTSQKLVLFSGYFTMIISRMFMFLILYHTLEDLDLEWIFFVSVALHISITFAIHMLAYHRKYDFFYGVGEDKRFTTLRFIRRKTYNENLMNPMINVVKRLLLILALSWSEFFLVILRHPIEFLQGRPHKLHQRSGRYFAGVYLLHFVEVVIVSSLGLPFHSHHQTAFHLSYLSVTLHLVAGCMFYRYFRFLHPDTHQSDGLLLTNNLQFCNITSKTGVTFSFNGVRIHMADQFNYRLQNMRPCVPCASHLPHDDQNMDLLYVEERDEHQKMLTKVESLLKKIRNSDNIEFETTNNNITDNQLIREIRAQTQIREGALEDQYMVIKTKDFVDLEEVKSYVRRFEEFCEDYLYWKSIKWEGVDI